MQRKCRCPNTKFLLFMLNNIKEWLSIAWEKNYQNLSFELENNILLCYYVAISKLKNAHFIKKLLSTEIELAKYFVITVYTPIP